MNLIDAMKQALADMKLIAENMEGWAAYAEEYFQKKHRLADDIVEANEAIQRLSKAIEEAEKVEPVAWIHKQGDFKEPALRQLSGEEIERGWEQYPLYTHPPFLPDWNAVQLLSEENLALHRRIAELEAEKVEPVAYAVKNMDAAFQMHNGCTLVSKERTDLHTVALYTAPPQREWVGLTDEERHEYDYLGPDFATVIQEVEEKVKAKNT